ncbi:long-chain fatty acid--CoA ligase [Streptomyces sp. MB09-01]|uniref:acyl-CoA synthetase n=1 Tax=Streptomyces sp. MB09-01 TaxID=3028666 RepID=UPI0029B1903C|nr:long-chain fatty acid--CoA ligase [Streptomyces sp. MB09-01]MDX3537512.1 long-chain fatty acid--CoA ligase [Streptomyces sp. MB09-01]
MPDYGIGSWPLRQARIRPDATALRDAQGQLTYARLAERVEQLAAALRARGIRRGHRVAHLGSNSVAALEALFATTRLGAIFVPLNTRLTADELALLLEDCAPALLFHDDAHQHLAQQVAGALLWTAGPHDQEAMTTDPSTPLPEHDGGDGRDGRDGRDEVGVGLGDDAVILYTSGTTGRPKGAVLTHGNLTFNTMNQLAHVDVLSTDTALCVAPLFHAAGLAQVLLPTLFKGGTVHVLPRFDARAALAHIAGRQITSFAAVPTMLQMMCDHPDFATTDLSHLRYVIYGGSSAPARVAAAWQRREVTLLQGYGMTEASPGITLAVPGPTATAKPLSPGVPHFFTDVRPRPGDAGRTPELLVSGLNVFRGYWKRPADTAAAMEGRWLRTGDAVHFDDDGWAHVADRIKDVIISGGENIYPAEVEARIDALPAVHESAVVGVPDERWGEVGLAYVVPAPGAALSAEALRHALRGQLAPYKIPHHVRVIDRLPRNATGKVMKEALRAHPPRRPTVPS